jgi:xanthine dehydrogenase molybdenum-binding subunit
VARNTIYNYDGEAVNISGSCSFNATNSAPSFQAAFAEVEVDVETGEVKILRMVLAHDIGKAVNPTSAEGQLEGGAYQGIGRALTEDFIVDMDTGVTLSANYDTYKIPRALDMPEMEIILVEKAEPTGPFGAKGAGEPGLVTTAPAIANAIYDAIGARVKDLPITSERVLRTLKEKLH